MVQKLEVLDTTLRDGEQTPGINLTLEDKVRIALALDELGVDYIEGGWPASNPKDAEFFRIIKDYSLSHAKVAAFGSTRRKGLRVYEDKNVESIIKADVDVAVIFGKSSVLHVNEVLHTSKEENLEMVFDTVNYLVSHGIKVIFDAEHFYYGYKEDPDYAFQVLKVAEEAGASAVVLCDTNGGTLPWEVYDITKKVVSSIKTVVGLHMHNDIGCAVANTLMGVLAGARHIQGTINGLGERTGNADLVQVIPTLYYKMGYNVLKGPESIKLLKKVSLFVYEVLSLKPNPYQPYVGDYAFAHKAGVHVDAILKNPRTYEHIDPELVGNSRKIVLSDLSGSSNIVAKLEELGIKVDKGDPKVKAILAKVKELGKQGYNLDIAPELALLIMLKDLGYAVNALELMDWKVGFNNGYFIAEVQIKGHKFTIASNDVFEALFNALTKAITTLYPNVSKIKVTKSSIELLDSGKYRITVEFSNLGQRFSFQSISQNVVEAFVKCVVHAYEYVLTLDMLKSSVQKPSVIDLDFIDVKVVK